MWDFAHNFWFFIALLLLIETLTKIHGVFNTFCLRLFIDVGYGFSYLRSWCLSIIYCCIKLKSLILPVTMNVDDNEYSNEGCLNNYKNWCVCLSIFHFTYSLVSSVFLLFLHLKKIKLLLNIICDFNNFK